MEDSIQDHHHLDCLLSIKVQKVGNYYGKPNEAKKAKKIYKNVQSKNTKNNGGKDLKHCKAQDSSNFRIQNTHDCKKKKDGTFKSPYKQG